MPASVSNQFTPSKLRLSEKKYCFSRKVLGKNIFIVFSSMAALQPFELSFLIFTIDKKSMEIKCRVDFTDVLELVVYRLFFTKIVNKSALIW